MTKFWPDFLHRKNALKRACFYDGYFWQESYFFWIFTNNSCICVYILPRLLLLSAYFKILLRGYVKSTVSKIRNFVNNHVLSTKTIIYYQTIFNFKRQWNLLNSLYNKNLQNAVSKLYEITSIFVIYIQHVKMYFYKCMIIRQTRRGSALAKTLHIIFSLARIPIYVWNRTILL